MRTHLLRTLQFVALVLISTATLSAQSIQKIEREDDDDNGRYDEPYNGGGGRIDRYLEGEVWTDQDDGDYYEGDPITIFFRTNRDAYVAIYSVDTRGRVSLLFPSERNEDNFVSGGSTYRLPGVRDNYNLRVSGPEGKEHIQLIASRERFPIPSWHRNSGIVSDWDNTDEFMDDINDQHFVRYPGQRFAYDRAVVFVNEWEEYYYRPIYRPVYRDWDVCGNVYIDYPFGGAVYINGIYWGCAPLYIPRIAMGWHTVTVYDPYGHCWESDFRVHHYRTVVLDRRVVRPQPGVRSKYKEVQIAGYVDPQRAGYKTVKQLPSPSSTKSRGNGSNDGLIGSAESAKRKYMRGDGAITKTERGYEIANSSYSDPSPAKGRSRYGSGSTGSTKSRDDRPDYNTGSNSDDGREYKKVKVGGGSSSGSTTGKSSGNSNGSSNSGEERKRVKVTQPEGQSSGSDKAEKGKSSGGSDGGKVKSTTKESPPPAQGTGTSGSSGSGSGKSKKPR